MVILKGKLYWVVRVLNEYGVWNDTWYLHPDGAFRQMEKEIESAYYRIKARTIIIPSINQRLLDHKEATFINKLIKSNCRGISKKMYGYLKGINERNC